MAVDTWPTDLPRNFIGDTYRESEAHNNLLETSELAIPKTRPLSSMPVRVVSGAMMLTRLQMESLRTFGRVTILQWSLPFWFPARTGEGDASHPGFWLCKFRPDGIPEFGLVNAARFTVPIGLYILP